MTLRPHTILAIAERDLRSEMKGRQGKGLPVISLLLLLPIALIGSGPDTLDQMEVRGNVPAVVEALPGVVRGRGTGFWTLPDGAIEVFGWRVPPPIREALDGDEPAILVEELHRPTRIPKRSLLFALVSASTLTGAVSASIGGERARHTLQALLTAAITRLEIVLGKWLAWTAFGALGACVASVAAILSGRSEMGSWLLAMPVVPALTVALGLWLVRQTEDVIAGTSVSLRVLPAVIGSTGMASWMLCNQSDLLGALVPLGGALMLAGDLWDGALLPSAVALSSSCATTVALLYATARDLEQTPPKEPAHQVRPWTALPDGLLAGSLWAALVPGPVLWGWAGNPAMTELLEPHRGLLAGALMLSTFGLVRWLRTLDPRARPASAALSPWLLAGTVAVWCLTLVPMPTSTNPWLTEAGFRLQLGLFPVGWTGVLVIAAQEMWFRGWMQKRAGWLPAAIAYALLLTPHHPVAGFGMALVMGGIARRGWHQSFLARLFAMAWMVSP